VIVPWIGLGVGVVLVLVATDSVLRTLVVPRGLTSKLAEFVSRVLTRHGFIAVADRFDDYETKDRILALSGPVSLLVLLFVWLTLYFLGYGLILWPLIDSPLPVALRESGSSLLTLGFAGTARLGPTIVHLVAALSGLVVVALQIAYLPTLYGAFNRREMLVTMLQSRAGAPAWGPELLMRAQMVSLVESLPDLYAEWERWAAEVAETHTTYPILIWFRSPHALRSWVVGLLAVMDSAALYLALAPGRAPVEARLCLRMGFTALRTIADAVKIPYDPDPFPDEGIDLTFEEYAGGVRRMEEAGFPLERTPEQAWADFQGWRINYERLCYALADLTVAVPGPWSGPRHHLPGMAIIPERPPNRRPDDPEARAEPKVRRFGWRA
jgi:hypothetical protein